MLVRAFDPIVGPNAQVAILGTLPSEESLELCQYYANPKNAFWFIMRELFGINGSYDERVQGLIQNRIAVWDVLQEARREGSSDSKMVKGTKVPNDFGSFFSKYPEIKTVFFNGQEAERLYRKLVIPSLNSSVITLHDRYLPSTSPERRITKCQKVDFWRVVQQALEND